MINIYTEKNCSLRLKKKYLLLFECGGRGGGGVGPLGGVGGGFWEPRGGGRGGGLSLPAGEYCLHQEHYTINKTVKRWEKIGQCCDFFF